MSRAGLSPAPSLSRQPASRPDERTGEGELARGDESPSPGRAECARRVRRTSIKKMLFFYIFIPSIFYVYLPREVNWLFHHYPRDL